MRHPSCKAPLSYSMIGTGPFQLAEFRVGDRAILKRVTKLKDGKDFNYWGGKVYLDEIHYYHFEPDNQLSAFESGDVDGDYQFTVEQLDLPKSLAGVIHLSGTAHTVARRHHGDPKPPPSNATRQASLRS